MANILLMANVNRDRILHLDRPLTQGDRCFYQDGDWRLGGGGANTGIGLIWAGHKVSLVSQVGQDSKGDALIKRVSSYGIECEFIQRQQPHTDEILLLITPDGERTIVRPQRTTVELPVPPRWQKWDALYINSTAIGHEQWAATALDHCLVVRQLAKEEGAQPCQILIASITDLKGRITQGFWEFAQQLAGEALEYFIVTSGDKGADLYSAKGKIHLDAVVAEVVDTTGAGDIYAAGVIHGLTSGMTMTQAMKEAAIWAAYGVASASSIPGDLLQNYLKNHQ